jgi:hypothetical protein
MTTTPRRSIPVPLVLLAFVLVGAGAGLWWASTPRGEPLHWNLTGMGGANSSAADMSGVDPLVVRVHVEQWPVEFSDDSWLTESVDESSDAVTITLRISPDYHLRTVGQATIGWYDTGGWVDVHLRQPLGSRRLFDGSTFPATEVNH